jgi:hypothetical protein
MQPRGAPYPPRRRARCGLQPLEQLRALRRTRIWLRLLTRDTRLRTLRARRGRIAQMQLMLRLR